MTENNIILALLSGFIGSIIGGGIAACGSYLAIKQMEYLRQSVRLKGMFRDIIAQINSTGHPANLVENIYIDNAVSDIMPYFNSWTRRAFSKAWDEYRYEKEEGEGHKDIPSQYTKMKPKEAGELVKQRLNNLIDLLK